MVRLGLCCQFFQEPIHFHVVTASSLKKLTGRERQKKIAQVCAANAQSLMQALTFCRDNGIGAFRINSRILPLKTHPDFGYALEDLPDGKNIIKQFKDCGRFARAYDIRTTFHPDQFVLLSSPDATITKKSIADLKYHAEVCEWVGADVINIHGGGGYGDKPAALARLLRNIRRLPSDVRKRLTIENDDRVYTPSDVLPVCKVAGIPFVYDVHHHRCLPDGQTVEAVTCAALRTWDREPLFHISSPWGRGSRRATMSHHDYIQPRDFPACWRRLNITVDVEAKAKEKAVLRLKKTILGK